MTSTESNTPEHDIECTTCEGHGEVNIPATAYDDDQPTKRCPACRGTGKQKDADHEDN